MKLTKQYVICTFLESRKKLSIESLYKRPEKHYEVLKCKKVMLYELVVKADVVVMIHLTNGSLVITGSRNIFHTTTLRPE